MDNMKLGHIFLFAFFGLFLLWIFTGGPERVENQTNPFVRPQEGFIGIPEIYGSGELTGLNQELAERNPFENWTPENTNDFSILLPEGWSHEEQAEFFGEKYGEITNGDIVLNYEFGKDVRGFSYLSNSDHEFTNGVVGGHPTIFVRPSSSGTVGAFIEKNRKEKILISSQNANKKEEQTEVFAIIQTIRF